MSEPLSTLLLAVRAAAWASGLLSGRGRAPPATRRLPHSRPRDESPVPISGWPYYLAGITIGGPVSDHGSHAGIKAAVRPAGAATGLDLLETAHYAAFGTVASRIDRSRLRCDGLPLVRTGIEFEPWGWRERARGPGGIEATGEATTLATDAFLLVARLANRGGAPVALRPRLEVLEDPDPVHEAQQPLRLSRGGRWRTAVDGAGVARIEYRRRTGPGPLAFDATRFHRTLRASFGPLARVRRPVLARSRFHVALAGRETVLAPGGEAAFFAVIGCGETAAEADAAAAGGDARLAAAGGAEGALEAVRADWARFLAALPAPAPPAALDADERRTLGLAATGLRMSAFAPRGRMPARSCFPAKVHFNLFAAWDVAIQALGLKEFDPALAKESLTVLLAGQRPDGCIPYGTGPDLVPFHPLLAGISQPPVVALAAREVFEADGARDRAWLADVHARLDRYARWWERRRRATGDDRLFAWRCAFESGWDDTPRIPNPRVAPIRAFGVELDLANLSGFAPARHVAAVDLNAWMFMFYESLAAIGRHLGRAVEAAAEEARARALAEAVEATLWDEERGAYLDREIAPGGTPGPFTRAITPALAWPLFAGLARDRRRVARLVEGHLLDPARLFGDPDDRAAPRFPVPSVAYDDPAYNAAADGYYWRGQVWLPPCWAVLVGLERYGYAAEAATLRVRLLRLLAGACEGGLFETYDARTGAIGFGSGSLSGAGEPACFQIGLTTAIALLVVLKRYERYPVVLDARR